MALPTAASSAVNWAVGYFVFAALLVVLALARRERAREA